MIIFLVAASASAATSLYLLRQSEARHAEISRNLQPAESFVQHISLIKGRHTVDLMADQPFRSGTPWMYVSKSAPLPDGYAPDDLVDVTVARAASSAEFKLEQQTNQAVEKLFAAAKDAGRSLIVVSAYRSNAEQKALYDAYMSAYGAAYTASHVAIPGTSEHATGYAVDINSYSAPCATSGSGCSLSDSDAQWLAGNAPKYGLLLRYPENKQAETNVAHEPWHFRYVGYHARTLTDIDLTFDEFVINLSTGRYEELTSYY